MEEFLNLVRITNEMKKNNIQTRMYQEMAAAQHLDNTNRILRSHGVNIEISKENKESLQTDYHTSLSNYIKMGQS